MPVPARGLSPLMATTKKKGHKQFRKQSIEIMTKSKLGGEEVVKYDKNLAE